jgi:hypothetical protein
MKVMKHILIAAFSFSIFVLSSCESDEPATAKIEIPQSFTIDIPSSISTDSRGSLSGRTSGDGDGIIEGNELYQAVPFFIFIGEESARIVESIFPIAAELEARNITELNYVSDDDSREKKVVINRDVVRDGKSYAYELTSFDVAADAQALQMLWNTNPVEGIAILNPYNIDRTGDTQNANTFLRIDYTEDDPNYEASMTVTISGLTPANDGDIDNLKLFAGRNGDIVDVMGNSNHPGLALFDPNFVGGRNYAFVGRGDETNNIGIINLALPPSSVTTDDVLVDYSVYQVLSDEIDRAVNGSLTQAQIDDILIEAQSPAYFNDLQGFITSGVDNKPVLTAFSEAFVDISALRPFTPSDIRTQSVIFLTN